MLVLCLLSQHISKIVTFIKRNKSFFLILLFPMDLSLRLMLDKKWEQTVNVRGDYRTNKKSWSDSGVRTQYIQHDTVPEATLYPSELRARLNRDT